MRKDGTHRWHNFCSGRLCPCDAAAGRTVDKFRVVFNEPHRHFVRKCQVTGRQYILLRAQGDGFLTDQLRRMVGTALCVFHGYISEEYVRFCFDSANIAVTPIAPKGLVILKQSRYGFHTHHRSLFIDMPVCSEYEWEERNAMVSVHTLFQFRGRETNYVLNMMNIRVTL